MAEAEENVAWCCVSRKMEREIFAAAEVKHPLKEW